MHHGTLCAQSESFYVEPSQTNHICARSTENITVLSHNTVSDVALPVKRSQLTQRQRKRIRDNKRKHKFYSNAYKLKDKVAEQEDLLADADQKVTALTVQQQLYKRKFHRQTKEISVLNSKIHAQEKRSINLSYGLRLLKTASGSRSNAVEINTASIPDISSTCITQMETKIGEGRFGVCTLARYFDYTVCIKIVKQSDLQQVLREAYFLHMAGGNKYVPHLFGVIKPLNAIMMSYHQVEGAAISMYEAYCRERSWMTASTWILHVISAAQAILHIHSRNILHNDIKLDNFIFSTSSKSDIEPILVDFGKACFIGQGKSYNLSVSEKEEYKLNHPHLAPDLRDGLCKQTTASDVFSFGFMLYTISKKRCITNRDNLRALSKECMLYNSGERPEIKDIIQCLTDITDIK